MQLSRTTCWLHNLLNTENQQGKGAEISQHYATQRCSVSVVEAGALWCRSYLATEATTFMAFGIKNLHKFQRAANELGPLPLPAESAFDWSLMWEASTTTRPTSPGALHRNVRPGDGVDVVDVTRVVVCLACQWYRSNNNLIIDSLHTNTTHTTVPPSWLEK